MVSPMHAVGKTALYQISQCGLMISSFLLARHQNYNGMWFTNNE